jgi:hypothetical protein
VKIPDLSLDELVKLGVPPASRQQGGASTPGPMAPLQQVLIQQLLSGADIQAAVRKVADEAAALSATTAATTTPAIGGAPGSPLASGGAGGQATVRAMCTFKYLCVRYMLA